MHILIDGYNLALPKATGVANYARHLTFALRDLGMQVSVLYGKPSISAKDSTLAGIQFFDDVPQETNFLKKFEKLFNALSYTFKAPVAKHINFSNNIIEMRPLIKKLPYSDYIQNIQNLFAVAELYFYFTKRLLKIRISPTPDVAHWTYPLPINIVGCKNIYTFHDLVPLKLPYTTLDKKNYYYNLVKKIASKADKIVTVSESSKKDIAAILNIDLGKIFNTYQYTSIQNNLKHLSEKNVSDFVRRHYGLKYKRYFLFVGAIEPKKNIRRLTDGFLNSGTSMPLVIVGPKGWMLEKEMHFLISKQHGPRSKFLHLEYIDFYHLVYLFKGARALVFPSIYEGFGLPVLEAMSLRTPVITSNVASLPEITGEAGLVVDPYSTEEIATAIRTLASNDGLAATLSEQGYERSKIFSKDAYISKLNHLYLSL